MNEAKANAWQILWRPTACRCTCLLFSVAAAAAAAAASSIFAKDGCRVAMNEFFFINLIFF